MATLSQPAPASGQHRAHPSQPATAPATRVTLLTGGIDPPYVYGVAMEIIAQGMQLELIGSDSLDRPEMHTTEGLHFLNLQHNRPGAGWLAKIARILAYYGRLAGYAATAKPRIFHILWNNKLVYFDRTFLMLYYKLLGKRVVFTAHNVNAGKRDGNDSLLNRATLRIQYRLADHIFVHTGKMKSELRKDFGVADQKITVIPFGINNSVPDTSLTPAEARKRLGIGAQEKTILFFGRIRQYKGLHLLVEAFQQIAARNPGYRLLIAGEPKKDSEQYWAEIQASLARGPGRDSVNQCIDFIPDADTEIYFKAADVSVLPYTMVFQSGVLFLSHSFGLPVIASDVGSLRDDIVEGETGLVCKPCDVADLVRAIETYFASDLFKDLSRRRREIREFANQHHSWSVVGKQTREVYDALLQS